MKISKLLILGLMAIVFAGVANAGSMTYFDIDKLGTKISKNGTDTLNGTFDITAAGIENDSYDIWLPYFIVPQKITDVGGFIPGQSTIASATVYFAVRDDQFFDRKEYLQVNIEGNNQGSFKVNLAILDFDVEASLLGSLDSSGQLSYTLSSTKGDFYVDYAALEVNTFQTIEDNPQIAPLPTSLWAGFSMLAGLAIIRKRLRSK